MKKILFYGNFGNNNETATNGQTSKTINFYKLVKDEFPYLDIDFFNTASFKSNFFKSFLNLRKKLNNRDVVIIFPGSVSSLLMIKIAKRKDNKCFFYPIVGGWVADKIQNKRMLISFLQSFKGVYPETEGLKNKLANLNIVDNVKILPTFTLREPIPFDIIVDEYKKSKTKNQYRFVYFGRITETKGIYLAIEAIKALNQETNRIFKLDFYGKKANGEDFEKFDSLLDDNIKYHGVMEDDDIWKLCTYDFFLFPTYYYGEGLPACCVESLIYGTPIIASNWKYNSEIVHDGYNGFIFNLDKNNLKDVILNSTKSDEEIMLYKINAFNDGKNYLPDVATKPFIEDFKEIINE